MARPDTFADTPYSIERRKDPVALFKHVLESVFMDNTPEETLGMFKYFSEQPTAFAGDAVYALDYVAANPPANLGETIREHGWVMLQSKTGAGQASDAEYLAWLKDITAQLRAIYEAAG